MLRLWCWALAAQTRKWLFFFSDLSHKETFLINQEETKYVKKAVTQILVCLIAELFWAPEYKKYPPLDKIVSQLKAFIEILLDCF